MDGSFYRKVRHTMVGSGKTSLLIISQEHKTIDGLLMTDGFVSASPALAVAFMPNGI